MKRLIFTFGLLSLYMLTNLYGQKTTPVHIITYKSKKYVTAIDGGGDELLANKSQAGNFEIFTMTTWGTLRVGPNTYRTGNKIVSFQAYNDNYLSLDDDFEMIADGEERRMDETFVLWQHDLDFDGNELYILSNTFRQDMDSPPGSTEKSERKYLKIGYGGELEFTNDKSKATSLRIKKVSQQIARSGDWQKDEKAPKAKEAEDRVPATISKPKPKPIVNRPYTLSVTTGRDVWAGTDAGNITITLHLRRRNGSRHTDFTKSFNLGKQVPGGTDKFSFSAAFDAVVKVTVSNKRRGISYDWQRSNLTIIDQQSGRAFYRLSSSEWFK